MAIEIEEFDKAVEQYLDTLDDWKSEEWYTTDQKLAKSVLTGFRDHLFKELLEKELRRKLYEELKAEFEGGK